jgi:hypothetical protein
MTDNYEATLDCFEIDHDAVGFSNVSRFYREKGKNYTKLALALEKRAKRAGKGSKEYARFLRLLETANEYHKLAKQ